MSVDEATVITQEAEDEQPQCSNCAYWIIAAEWADRGGECHRLAPSLPKYIDGKLMEWPITREGDWCGQYATIGGRDREPGPFISPRFKRPYKPTRLAG